jgi:hypothetical protein
MNTAPPGNLNGIDVAIAISSNDVSLDLNGLTITVNDLLGQSLSHVFYAIAETAAFSQITITNGSVRVTSISNRFILGALNFPKSLVTKFSELNLVAQQPNIDFAAPAATLLSTGGNSLVYHVVTDGYIRVTCPSTAVDKRCVVQRRYLGWCHRQ